MPREDLNAPGYTTQTFGCLLKICGAIFVLMMVLIAALYGFYGVNSHHVSRNSIWHERIRSLTPPTATGITLDRDFLDHYATYTVSENDLVAFLNERFARKGEVLDAFAERSRPNSDLIGKAIGRLGWVVSDETVVYSYAASNGGVSTYFHDPTSGRTYQSSAHW